MFRSRWTACSTCSSVQIAQLYTFRGDYNVGRWRCSRRHIAPFFQRVITGDSNKSCSSRCRKLKLVFTMPSTQRTTAQCATVSEMRRRDFMMFAKLLRLLLSVDSHISNITHGLADQSAFTLSKTKKSNRYKQLLYWQLCIRRFVIGIRIRISGAGAIFWGRGANVRIPGRRHSGTGGCTITF